jgi:hypothetical protein
MRSIHFIFTVTLLWFFFQIEESITYVKANYHASTKKRTYDVHVYNSVRWQGLTSSIWILAVFYRVMNINIINALTILIEEGTKAVTMRSIHFLLTVKHIGLFSLFNKNS